MEVSNQIFTQPLPVCPTKRATTTLDMLGQDMGAAWPPGGVGQAPDRALAPGNGVVCEATACGGGHGFQRPRGEERERGSRQDGSGDGPPGGFAAKGGPVSWRNKRQR